ncbi:hypothetical protein SmJEL517_g04934 [Synchytrium microbalum]|uniref:Mitochondrial import inner membrane translocase subunit TIM50 n=1 Tax=Synchytrium microbalum TaxID=1806994 RepID=A0A507BXL6_9FUNG|nr:uncharacterized protein SmJEL517_g04934 [Synchytrium microbalum]TPX31841.1 hypothetical protein SmJEL517_g04934 [Synchytrium microbalum]
MAGRILFMRGLRTSSTPTFSAARNTSIPSFLSAATASYLPKNAAPPPIQMRASSFTNKTASQSYRSSVSSASSPRCSLSSPPGSFMRGISSTSTHNTTNAAKAISSRGVGGSNTKSVSSSSGKATGESVTGTAASGMDDGKGREDGQDMNFIDRGGGLDPGGGNYSNTKQAGNNSAGYSSSSSGSSSSSNSSSKQAEQEEQAQAAQAYGLGLLDAAVRASASKSTGASRSSSGGPPSSSSSGNSPPNKDDDLEYDERPEPARDPLLEEEERKRTKQASLFLLVCSGLAALGTFVILGMPSPDDKPVAGESMLGGYHRRAKGAVRGWYLSFSDPISDKLLPDPLPEPYQRPYTMVIALNDALIHSTWDKDNGWRAGKRPHVDWFLSYMSQFYEIVVFTSGMPHVAHPIIEKLDPYRFIMYRLYRDSTRFIDNKFVKDLSVLNRDLGKTIIIDINPDSYSLQPDNAIPIKKWTGEADDMELLRLIPFLEALAMSGAPDVRPVLRSYQGKDIPAAWASYQARLREEFEQKRKATAAANRTTIGSILSSLFGGGTRVAPSSLDANPVDILQQQAREMREQFWREQEGMKEQMEAQRKIEEKEMERQLEAMKAKKLSLWEFMATTQQPPQQHPTPNSHS